MLKQIVPVCSHIILLSFYICINQFFSLNNHIFSFLDPSLCFWFHEYLFLLFLNSSFFRFWGFTVRFHFVSVLVFNITLTHFNILSLKNRKTDQTYWTRQSVWFQMQTGFFRSLHFSHSVESHYKNLKLSETQTKLKNWNHQHENRLWNVVKALFPDRRLTETCLII